ncbi:MAG: hypothetical protein AAGF26_16315 [Cyanobacteria bacterium P01_G01_bin.49]
MDILKGKTLKNLGFDVIKITNKNSVVAMVVVMAGIFGQNLLSLANETRLVQVPVEQPQLSPPQEETPLEGIENQQWQWNIEEEDGNNQGVISDQYPLDVNSSDTNPSVNPRTEEREWQDSQKGDPRESGGTVPLLEF